VKYIFIYVTMVTMLVNVDLYTEYPGEKINILGDHSICHSKQKSVYVHVSCSEWFPR
jgi:hypothetical protein